MGTADLVPGISGGTVAFILGIYQNLLQSIRTLTLIKSDQSRQEALSFLFSLGLGILTALASFTHLIAFLLNQEFSRSGMYAIFLGLIFASTFFCLKLIPQWRFFEVGLLGIGVILGYLFSSADLIAFAELPSTLTFASVLWLVCCGMAAVFALLLPGISGSYVLMILGAYPIVMQALGLFLKQLFLFHFEVHAFQILLSLASGILVGAACFSHLTSWLLKNYYSFTIAFFTGVMLGAARILWPFWTYQNHTFLLIPLKPYLPSLTDPIFLVACLLFIISFISAFFLERFAHQKKKRYNTS